MTESEGPIATSIPETAARMEISAHVVREMIEQKRLPVVAKLNRQTTLVNWRLVAERVKTGQEFTPNWWEPAE